MKNFTTEYRHYNVSIYQCPKWHVAGMGRGGLRGGRGQFSGAKNYRQSVEGYAPMVAVNIPEPHVFHSYLFSSIVMFISQSQGPLASSPFFYSERRIEEEARRAITGQTRRIGDKKPWNSSRLPAAIFREK